MPTPYDPSTIEPKWQAFWQAQHTFRTPTRPTGRKAYILDMFPYPSGAGLHVGHPEGYTATDIVARYLRARGVAVLHPMGWDAFGLPAEQHAIRTGTHPRATTEANIANFRRQLQSLGFSYDWQREINTTDPNYLRWTQWIFLRLFERGLAYQDEVAVNWCAALGTVLANEEVTDGKSEIGGHPVERLPLRQWMLRITAYADKLLSGLSAADWPESTRSMQRAWIGRSEGASVRFAVEGDAAQHIEVFTTRPDTLFGVTFLVVAPEHPLVEALSEAEARPAVQAYVRAARQKSDRDRRSSKDKTGVFSGGYALHPLSGARIPVWVADYVLADYGTGAVMAVPAHDERDYAFAETHRLPILPVVRPEGAAAATDSCFAGEGIACASGPFDGLPTAECKARITAALEEAGRGQRQVQTKLRDWVFSRQRYWGEPIPIVFPVECDGDPRRGDPCRIRYDQPEALRDDELPVLLPALDDFRPSDDPQGPLARAVDWRFIQRNGRWYARETNTMPQWAGSCWYYLRFCDPHNQDAPFDTAAADAWLPVDLYIGGAEHAVLHLLYARFWHQVLHDMGLVAAAEPFQKLVHQGMILGELEYTAWQDAAGQWVDAPAARGTVQAPSTAAAAGDSSALRAQRIDAAAATKNDAGEWVLKAAPHIRIEARAHKMSKSRGNVVSPDHIITEFGADAMRIYEMFMGPLEASKPWNTQGLVGVRRFLERAHALCLRDAAPAALPEPLLRLLHRSIRKVSEDIEALRLNTAISTLMVLVNELGRHPALPAEDKSVLIRLLHPFAPHLAEELWQAAGHAPSVQAAPWPVFDPALCEESEVEVPVQINGKVRARLRLPKDADEAQALAAARQAPRVQTALAQSSLRKVIWVPGKILNLIVQG
ncbi:MAG: leucine--tRNA ligase [Polyangiales bacterium]